MSGTLPASPASAALLKRTTSRCPVCGAACPAEVWRGDGRRGEVWLKRTCARHGEVNVCIASDARFYWVSKGRGGGECGCGGASAGVACCADDGSVAGPLGGNACSGDRQSFEKLSTCLALIEVVRACNLDCPVCYADSPVGAPSRGWDAVPLADLQSRIQGVIDRKGKIEILQLSGGEPTLHPRLFELLAWARDHPGIEYVLLNTNGVRLAHEAGLAEQLGACFVHGGLQVYLQFDGPQIEGQYALRGADLRRTRVDAIDRCAQAGLPVTLAMTVIPDNLPFVWEAIEFGLKRPGVHGVTFQPLVRSGRGPWQFARAAEGRHEPETTSPTPTRLNTADIILSAVEHSHGALSFADFTPLPCGDPNCAAIGYLLRVDGGVRPISEFVDFRRLQGFLHDRLRYGVEDLARCGCESEPLGRLLKDLELRSSLTFRIMVKPFMDAWTWDQDRIDRCCTHVIRPDGRLDSFCRYYSGFADCQGPPG